MSAETSGRGGALHVDVGCDVDDLVTTAVHEAFAGTDEVGFQVAVCMDGDLIVDVCAGVADCESDRPVDAETLFPVFSVTKGVVTTAILRAADDGRLDLDAPISRYWPQFARGGKATTTVTDLLTHSVGIPAMPDRCSISQMCDWDQMVTAVENMTPLWEPGTETGYHAYTYGWMAGELLCRASGASDPKACLYEALSGVGVTDFWIGLEPSRLNRVATLYTQPGEHRPSPTTLFDRVLPAAIRPQPVVFNRRDVQLACLPAAGGIGTAAGLAQMYDALASGARIGSTDHGEPLKGSSAVKAAEAQTEAVDLVLGRPIRKGLGYFLSGGDNPQTAPMGGSRAFGHPGSGGSNAWADTTHGAGIAILKNLMAGPAESSIMTIAAAARQAAARVRARCGESTS